MKLIIDIDKKLKSAIYRCGLFLNPAEKVSLIDAINNGTPIPDNATNGDVIKAMFPELGINSPLRCDNLDWWNAPYTAESEE